MLKVLLDTNIVAHADGEDVVPGPISNHPLVGTLQEFNCVDRLPKDKFLRKQVPFLWGIARDHKSTDVEFYSSDINDLEYIYVDRIPGPPRSVRDMLRPKIISSGLLTHLSFALDSSSKYFSYLNTHPCPRFAEIRDAFGLTHSADAALVYSAELNSLDAILTCDTDFRGIYGHTKKQLGLRLKVMFPKELADHLVITPAAFLRDRSDRFPDRFWR